MKRILFFTLFVATCCMTLFADDTAAQINLQHRNKHTHYEFPVPADQPDVYHDTDAQEIIVDGDGTAAYYDVEIASAGTLAVVISTQVNGTYDTIDVSSLPSDHVYVITLYSPTGNTFEGTFLIE